MNLDSQQIVVMFVERPEGIEVVTSCYADKLIARKELKRAGLPVVE
jgi:hypothetical protein